MSLRQRLGAFAAVVAFIAAVANILTYLEAAAERRAKGKSENSVSDSVLDLPRQSEGMDLPSAHQKPKTQSRGLQSQVQEVHAERRSKGDFQSSLQTTVRTSVVAVVEGPAKYVSEFETGFSVSFQRFDDVAFATLTISPSRGKPEISALMGPGQSVDFSTNRRDYEARVTAIDWVNRTIHLQIAER